MTVIYQTPQDISFFEEHYFNVHVPLAKQLPGLLRYTISEGPVASPTEHGDVYRIANLYFESQEAMRNAFSSGIGQQCAADRKILAPHPEQVQIYLYQSVDL